MSISVILCTADRPQHIQATLAAFATVAIPNTLEAELVIVDNGRDTRTATVVSEAVLPQFAAVRYVHSNKRGLARARNWGLAAAQGDVLVMTDDDIRPAPNWLEEITQPLRANEADAVAGGVRLAPGLKRPWMEKVHMGMLASTEWAAPGEELPALIGANMAFHRRVLERVPAFDVELGAGTRYGGEEILFSFQLDAAGFRRTSCLKVEVEHHFEAGRLRREDYTVRMQRTGREHAYIAYHWRHEPVGQVRRNAVRSALDLIQARRASLRQWPHPEGMPLAEMKAIEIHFFYRQYLMERRRPRNYDRLGLVKRRGELPEGIPG